MRHGAYALGAILAFSAGINTTQALPVNYDEARDGDLAQRAGYNPANYTEFTLGLGLNKWSGTYHHSYWGAGSTWDSDTDAFYFRVPVDTQIASITFYFAFTATPTMSEHAYFFEFHDMTMWNQTGIYGIPYPAAYDSIWLIPGPYPGYPPADTSPVELFLGESFSRYYTSTPTIVGPALPTPEGRYWWSMGHLQSGYGILDMTYRLEILLSPIQRPVPEPGTLALLGIGLAGLAVSRRRISS